MTNSKLDQPVSVEVFLAEGRRLEEKARLAPCERGRRDADVLLERLEAYLASREGK